MTVAIASPMTMLEKAIRVEMLKGDDARGSVRAVFATFGVPDLDKDVILRSAFVDGQNVTMAAAHDHSIDGWIGTGKITTTDTQAIFEGKFHSDAASQAVRTKLAEKLADGVNVEWSWAFMIPEGAAKHDPDTYGEPVRILGLRPLNIREVSPVLTAAGIDTGTVSIKSAVTLAQRGERLAADTSEFLVHARAAVSMRAKEGRILSQANADRVTSVADALEEAAGVLRKLLDDAKPAMTQGDCTDAGGTWDPDTGMCLMADDGKAALQRQIRDLELEMLQAGLRAA